MSAEVMSGGGGSPKLQTKTVSPSTSSQNITPDSNYDGLSKVTVNAMPTGSLNGISINSNGLITSSVGTSGYLSSGMNKTLQLQTQNGITITPGTDTKIAVDPGRYTTGTIQVQGDSNLVPGNIVSGVSIFGVTGTRQDFYYCIIRAGNTLFENTQTIYWDNVFIPPNFQMQSISIKPNGYYVPSDGGIYAFLDGYYALNGDVFQFDGYNNNNINFSHSHDQNSSTFYMTIGNSNYYWSKTYYTLNIAGYIMPSQ